MKENLKGERVEIFVTCLSQIFWFCIYVHLLRKNYMIFAFHYAKSKVDFFLSSLFCCMHPGVNLLRRAYLWLSLIYPVVWKCIISRNYCKLENKIFKYLNLFQYTIIKNVFHPLQKYYCPLTCFSQVIVLQFWKKSYHLQQTWKGSYIYGIQTSGIVYIL